MLVSSSASPGYVAMEVEHTAWPVAPGKPQEVLRVEPHGSWALNAPVAAP